MLPVAHLIDEHKVIKKILKTLDIFRNNLDSLESKREDFIVKTVDFFRTYADACHHGKEEQILFKRLQTLKLSAEEKKLLDELIKEHQMGRELVAKIEVAKKDQLIGLIDSLMTLYKQHIYKEESKFFFLAFKHFSEEEQEEMRLEFLDVDKRVLQDKYLAVINCLDQCVRGDK